MDDKDRHNARHRAILAIWQAEYHLIGPKLQSDNLLQWHKDDLQAGVKVVKREGSFFFNKNRLDFI